MAEEGKSAINYNYVEAGFATLSIDGVDGDDLDGNSFGGSFAIDDNFNLLMSKVSGDTTIEGVTIDAELNRFGIGYHTPLSASTDLQVSYEDAKLTFAIDAADWSDSGDGNVVSVGVATMLSDNTQVSVSLDRWKAEGESESGNTIAIVHQVTDTIALTAKRIDMDGGDLSSYGVRYNF